MIYTDIIYVLIVVVGTVLAGFLCRFLHLYGKQIIDKIQNEEVKATLSEITQIIESCVIATNQEYVDSLKASGQFDEEAQETAFNRTKSAIMQLLSAKAIDFITDKFNDLNLYLDNQIEKVVKQVK